MRPRSGRRPRRRRRAIITLPDRSSLAASHQSARRRARVSSGSSETVRRSSRSAKARYSRPRPPRTASRVRRSSSSRWRRLSRSWIAPSCSAMAAKRPPAPTAGSWRGSPRSIAFPFASSTRERRGARMRVSAIPASSTTSTDPCGRPPSRLAAARSPWRVVAGMPALSASRSAAIPDGAAPRTETPDAANASAAARRALVFPEPAGPTTQRTRSGLAASPRTIRSCSGGGERWSGRDARSASMSSPATTGAPAPWPRSTSASASRSMRSSSVVD